MSFGWRAWGAVVAGLGLLAYLRRKDVGQAASAVAEEAGTLIEDFKTKVGILPAAAQQYADVIEQVATESGERPQVLTAIGWRETRWGTSPDLDVQGPSGTGDFTARTGHWLNTPRVQTVDGPEFLPIGWSSPKDNFGDPLPGPYAIPDDGRGWGRGLMQIDFQRAETINWEDPLTNVREAAKVLAEKRAYISSHVADLTPDELERATVAAYNHGEGGSVNNLLAGRDVDSGTTGGNYSADVLSNAGRWS